MRSLLAPAKINLSLVVGPIREDGKHEVVTILQPLELHDVIELAPADALSVAGYEQDTIVGMALRTLAAEAGVEPRWRVELTKQIPVAAGLGGGSSDAAAALKLANTMLREPLTHERLARLAARIGADVPFFLERGPQLGTGDGSLLTAIEIPQDFSIVLVLPSDVTKTSTADVYAAFDARNGAAGFAARREALFEALEGSSSAHDLAKLPGNDLAESALSARLRELGAFRADVSGAGPCVYGLFADAAPAAAAARALAAAGQTWMTLPQRLTPAA